MSVVNYKFCIKYIKIVNNFIQIKKFLETYIPYFKNIFNVKSLIINKHD